MVFLHCGDLSSAKRVKKRSETRVRKNFNLIRKNPRLVRDRKKEERIESESYHPLRVLHIKQIYRVHWIGLIAKA